LEIKQYCKAVKVCLGLREGNSNVVLFGQEYDEFAGILDRVGHDYQIWMAPSSLPGVPHNLHFGSDADRKIG